MAKLWNKFKRKNFWGKILSLALALIVGIGSIAGVTALVKHLRDEKKTISPVFWVGGLTEAGIYEETDDMIYTKNAFEAKGLEVKLDFDSNVKYQVFFYDELDKFVSCTEVYTESAKISVPLECSARMEITPIWGPDAPLEKEIKWYQVGKYASQVEIRVDKNQERMESDFTAYKLSDTTYFTKYEGQLFDIDSVQLIENAIIDTYMFKHEDDYNKMYLRVENIDAIGDKGFTIVFVSADGTVRTSDWFNVNRGINNMDTLIPVMANETIYIYADTEVFDSEASLMLCFI